MGKKKGSSKNPDSLKDEGNKAFSLGSYNQAIDLYSQAIELKQSHIYYSNRANAYIEIGDFSKALIDCDEAIKIEPGYAKAYVRKGNALFNLKRGGEAKEMFEKAYSIEPTEDVKKLIDECIQD